MYDLESRMTAARKVGDGGEPRFLVWITGREGGLSSVIEIEARDGAEAMRLVAAQLRQVEAVLDRV